MQLAPRVGNEGQRKKSSTKGALNIIIATIDGGGNLPPLLAVAKQLSERGHRVRVMGEPSARDDVAAMRATFRPWTRAPHRQKREPGKDLVADWAEATPQDGAKHVINKVMCGPAKAYADDLLEEFDREPADLVLSLDMLLGILVACEARGVRHAILAPNLSMFPIPGLPPFGTGLPAARNDEDRALYLDITRGVTALFDTGIDDLNAVRRSFHLQPLEHVFDQLKTVDAHFMLTSKAFDFTTGELPNHTHYVGPMTDDPAWAKQSDQSAILELKDGFVLVSLSTSFQNHTETVNRIVAALADLQVPALVTAGPSLSLESIKMAQGIKVVTSLSHEDALKHAALVITHGGHGTVMRSLRHGVPMLILPHGRDQADNAIRVTERGAGLSLNQYASTGQIKSAIKTLLESESYRQNALLLGSLVSAEVANSDLMARIESLS